MLESTEPDLVLHVTQKRTADGRSALRYLAKARDPELRLHYKGFESDSFLVDPQSHFRDFFRDIGQLQRNPSEEVLADRGAQLFQELLPVELQRRLWALLGSVHTIQILSDETWIPWEILRVQDPHGSSAPDRFLVDAFSLTRWQLGRDPVLSLPLRRIALVVPRNADLPQSSAERDFVKTLAGPGREVVEISPVKRDIKNALASGQYDGWHFAGHGLAMGESPQRWSVLLEGGEQLRPADLYGEARQLGQARPLVFLNACHSGRGAASLTTMGGLATAFLQAGAGAFLGSYWEVQDDAAFFFAQEIYKHLLAGRAIADAVRSARLSLRAKFPGTLDWLAYTLFAHPLARCLLDRSAERARPTSPRRAGKGAQPPGGGRPMRLSSDPAGSSLTSPGELPKPAPGTERINEKDETVLLYVPGGDFTLGAEGIHIWSRPIHVARLSPFWIGKFPVTNEQYARFLAENPGCAEPAFWEDPSFNRPRHPVVGLSWAEAQAYCRWAGLELPSEAQWEAAARGKDGRPFPWGKELPTLVHANFGSAMKGPSAVDSHPAGAGPYGTFDQAGNVWEWCADPWASDAYLTRQDSEPDPIAQGNGIVRALRGGSWGNPAQDLHAAYRDRGTAKLRFNNQGFRCIWRPL